MAHLLELKTHIDDRGSLTVMEIRKEIPFEVKRIFYIYDTGQAATRGGHRHRKNIQALICIKGSCKIYVNDGLKKEEFDLDKPNKCLILEPKDWHTMYNFSPEAFLLVLASEHYDVNDYIDEEYQ